MATSIVDFYSGRFKHPSGRTIEGVLEMDDDALEAAHDVIQYLFPLTERSQCQPHSPVLSRAEVEEFRSSKELKVMLSESLGRMLKFYGLSVVMDAVGPVVWRGPGWDERSPNWLQKGDHNHLRLTRMVKSLKLLGLGHYADALQKFLLEEAARTPAAFTRETVGLWAHATD